MTRPVPCLSLGRWLARLAAVRRAPLSVSQVGLRFSAEGEGVAAARSSGQGGGVQVWALR